MNCRDVDQLLCDYLDGELSREQQISFEQHIGQCSNCAQMLADSELALGFLRQAPAAEPPIELIADIIHDTIGVRGTLPVLAPVGGGDDARSGWLRPFFNPFLQPRFAMSMVMAVLSLSMLSFYAKGVIESFRPGQSRPAAVVESVGEQFKRAWDATTEFFETVKGLYKLQTEFGTERERQTAPAPAGNAQPVNPATGPAPSQPSQPPQQESGR
jgi:hypothetical protein